MKSSPQRNTFQRERYLDRCREKDQEPSADYLGLFDYLENQKQQREAEETFRQNNLEYDLRSCDWICSKAKASESYSQNIYAALCNQSWQKNEVWPLLKAETWSCSWRYAGGIVADMLEKGDYIDWYCSGIRDSDQPDRGFVSEGTITDEIREDFFKLGWIPVNDNEQT